MSNRIEKLYRRSGRVCYFSSIFLPALAAAFFSSCAPLSEITIEILQPAEVTLPGYAENISFMNRSYHPITDSLPGRETKLRQNEIFVLDTAVNYQFFRGLADGMNKSPLFEIDTIEVIQARREGFTGNLDPLDKFLLEAFRNKTGSDILVCLENFAVRDTFKIDYISDVYAYNNGQFDLYVQVNSKALWRVYDLHAASIMDDFVQYDTTYWYAGGKGDLDNDPDLPSLLTAYRDAANSNGFAYSRRISPGWYETERYLYRSGGKVMRKAAGKAVSGDWSGAESDWIRLSGDASGIKTRARALYNLAVKQEVDDDIPGAVEKADSAYRIDPDEDILQYLNILLLREVRYEILKKQVRPSSLGD